MSSQGYIYVLINPAMPGLLKIGLTTKTPEERVKELSSATGVPINFILIYKEFFQNCAAAEKAIHAHLEAQGFRLNKGREFFEAEPSDVVDIIKDIKAIEKELVFDDADSSELEYSEQQPWEHYEKLGHNYYSGTDNCFQDYKEAYHNFKKAYELGSITAPKLLGLMHDFGVGVNENKQEALRYYKEGAKRGDISCWCEIASYYTLTERHFNNFMKSVENYIANINHNEIIRIHEPAHMLSAARTFWKEGVLRESDLRYIYDIFEPFVINYLSSINYNDTIETANYDESINVSELTHFLFSVIVFWKEGVISYSDFKNIYNCIEPFKVDIIYYYSMKDYQDGDVIGFIDACIEVGDIDSAIVLLKKLIIKQVENGQIHEDTLDYRSLGYVADTLDRIVKISSRIPHNNLGIEIINLLGASKTDIVKYCNLSIHKLNNMLSVQINTIKPNNELIIKFETQIKDLIAIRKFISDTVLHSMNDNQSLSDTAEDEVDSLKGYQVLNVEENIFKRIFKKVF